MSAATVNAPGRWAVVLGLLLLAGCSNARRGHGPDGGGPRDAAVGDAADAGPARDAADAAATADSGRDGGRDAATTDAGRDAATADAGADAGRDAGGGDLHPELETADPDETPCSTPGSLSECGSIEVCRFFSSSEGRCTSCGACGNLGDSCTAPQDCDILFACFRNTCTNYCTLGTSECGRVDDCLDVGHPTRGVCRP